MIPAGTFAPGVGAHYVALRGTGDINPDGTINPSSPGSLIFDGNSPTSRLVGLMYLSPTEPIGFAGPNDHWHRHMNTCVKFGAGGIEVPFAADSDVTRAMCNAVGGQFMERTTWMVHAWVVPGWESPEGVFSHANPEPALRRRYRQGRQGRVLSGDVSNHREKRVVREVPHPRESPEGGTLKLVSSRTRRSWSRSSRSSERRCSSRSRVRRRRAPRRRPPR